MTISRRISDSLKTTVQNLERVNKWLSLGTGAFLAVGGVGWAGGHYVASFYQFLSVFAVLTFAGTAGFVVLAFINAHRVRRPLILRALGVVGVLFGMLFIGFNQDPFLKYPMALLAALAVVLLIIGLKDWSQLPPPTRS